MLKKTPLFEKHQELGAKFVTFAGWEMPLYYRGIHAEVMAVRETGGLFDVSHMGRISIQGADTLPFLEHLSSNSVYDKPFGKAFYTVFCNESGGAVDDLMVYLINENSAFIVVNAANRLKSFQHLINQSFSFSVWIEPHFENEGIISLQGPNSSEIVRDLTFLNPFEFAFLEGNVIVSRTGYTGEEGYELFGSKQMILRLWEKLLLNGKQFEIGPCGLGSRDILRLEMGYALYGHELSDSIYPLESVAKWATKLEAHEFLGKKALLKAKINDYLRYPVALVGQEKIPAREGYPILYHGQMIGTVTSGAFSPTLQRPIALGIIDKPLPFKELVNIRIRSNDYLFEIVKLPFIKRPK